MDEALFADLFRHAASIEGTGKRKKEGDLADTRLGKPVSSRWSNERFRQTMLLVLEFRLKSNFLSSEDVEFLRIAAGTWRLPRPSARATLEVFMICRPPCGRGPMRGSNLDL